MERGKISYTQERTGAKLFNSSMETNATSFQSIPLQKLQHGLQVPHELSWTLPEVNAKANGNKYSYNHFKIKKRSKLPESLPKVVQDPFSHLLIRTKHQVN